MRGNSSNIETNSSIYHVLKGGFMTQEYNNWKVPSFSLKYFVSSTFTDTHEERNVLITKLLPELNAIARPHCIDITFVDMRWGVKDENTDDHKTWDACKVELERCIIESCETFFISLQGCKYGYRPLPREIEQARFDDHIYNKYTGSDRDELVALAKKWYVLDTNSVPKKYVLTRLDDSNRDEYWSDVLNKLLKLLTGLTFDEDLYIGDSVTNWEAVHALNKNSSTNNRVVWMKREIVDATTDVDDPWKEFDDARGNADVTDRLRKLVDTMNDKLGGVNSHVYTTTIDSVLSIKNKPNSAFTSYIEEFYTKMKSLLTSELNRVVQRKETWYSDAYGSRLAGNVCLDMLHHCSFARGKVLDFEGRDDLVSAAMEMIKQPNREKGIQGSVIGQSGCGKTCFIAKLASLLYDPAGVPVVIRFCGTNDDSSSGVKLLQSIIRQIHFIYGLDATIAIPEVYFELVTLFYSLMADYPVMLLIDSIDQLTNDNQERSDISFLSGIKVHRDGRVIVSCLPDDYDSRTKSGYWYGCDTTLKEWQVPRVDIKSISNEVELILDSYLAKSGRCLTSAQCDVVLSSAAQQLDPTALFIKLAAKVACSWKSSDSNCVIGNSVPSLIDQIFDEVQRNYGAVLIKAVIGFITLAVNGITSQEMEDLLSLDEEVMEEVNKYNASSRLPSHVWLRVKHELAGLLAESDQGCMRWYHRQLKETASKRYSEEEKVYYHQIMGRYFSNLVDVGIGARKGIYKQKLLTKENIDPVWFRSSNSYINKRRCTEGGYHLIRGRLYVEAIEELCDLEHVCAYVKSGNGFRLVNNLLLIDKNMSTDEKRELVEACRRAHHYLRWLLKDMNLILTDIEMKIITTATSEPLASNVKRDVTQLLKETGSVEGSRANSFTRDSWVREVTMGAVDNFSPLLMNLVGHLGHVVSVSLSVDGTRIVSGSYDRTVRVWDSVTGQLLHTLTGHTDVVTSVSISVDGTRIVSGSFDKTIKVWDSVTGQLLHTLTGHSYHVTSVSISVDVMRIVSGSEDKTIKVWDTGTGQIIRTLTGHDGNVNSILFSSDGARIISGSGDKTIKVWDSVTGQLLHTITGHTGGVTSVSISADGMRIVSGSWDETIKVWDSVTGQVLHTLTGHDGNVNSVLFSQDGTLIVSGGKDCAIKMWDSGTGQVLNTITGYSGYVTSVSISVDGTRIVSGSSDETIKVWDTGAGQVLHTITGHSGDITSVSISVDGTRIVSGSLDKTVKMFDSVTGQVLHTLTGHDGNVMSVSISGDGTRIVSGSDDKTIKVWDAGTGQVLHTLTGHDGYVMSVSISSDGTRIVSGSDDKTIKIWDCTVGQVLHTLTGHSYRVASVSLSVDGTRIVSGSWDRTIKVWNGINGDLFHTLTDDTAPVTSVSLSRDGTRIVSGSYDKTVRVWDSVTGQLLLTLGGYSAYETKSVSFNGDGTRIISGSKDSIIKVWDSVTGQDLHTLTRYSATSPELSSVAFSVSGTRIVSGGYNQTIKVWESMLGTPSHRS